MKMRSLILRNRVSFGQLQTGATCDGLRDSKNVDFGRCLPIRDQLLCGFFSIYPTLSRNDSLLIGSRNVNLAVHDFTGCTTKPKKRELIVGPLLEFPQH
jgi:phage gpG-like protein